MSASDFSPASPGWSEFALAREAARAALELGSLGTQNRVTLLLLRAEARLLLLSLLRRAGHSGHAEWLDATGWPSVESLSEVRRALAQFSADEREELKAWLGPEGEASLGGLNATQCRRRSRQLGLLTKSLLEALSQYAEPFECSRKRRQWRLAMVLGLVALFGCVWAFFKLDLYPRANQALRRPVTVSSREPTFGSDPQRLVDGNRGNLGIHSVQEAKPFVVVDLGAKRHFDKIAIYNRVDCCQDRAVPLLLEVSDDGKRYVQVAERKEPFQTWVLRGLDTQGRYVRLRLARAGILHLSEIEIY